MRLSALTLVRGREAHLANLLRSIAAQAQKPDELVIAWMQDASAADLPDPGVPVRHVIVPGEPMPLAAARNRAAEAASGEHLVFLDVDCIASPSLVAAYAAASDGVRGLFLGEVLYLPAGAVELTPVNSIDFARLDQLGQVHPSKPPIPREGIRLEPDSGELWGLSFCLPRQAYLDLGGMDERFSGYGGEETDFAARVAASGLPTYWTAKARAYHQHHPVHVPPLHHFEHILVNAQRFRDRHGRWCMDYWLGQFAEAGLIEWDATASRIETRRRPAPEEIAASRRADDCLFS